MARGTKVPFAATSDRLPSHLSDPSGDYYHLSLIPNTGQCVQIPICAILIYGYMLTLRTRIKLWLHYATMTAMATVTFMVMLWSVMHHTVTS